MYRQWRGAIKLADARSDNGHRAPTGTDPNSPQYSPDQSQYVPALESWPPQCPTGYLPADSFHQQVPAPPQRDSVTLPWIFAGLGLLIPLSALTVGILALTRTHSDNRYVHIALAGFGVFALTMFLNASAVSRV